MPLTLVPTTLAQALKAETEVLHRSVEEILLPKLGSIASADDYAVILKMFRGYFNPLEKLIQQFISTDILPDITKRRTADLILQDLQALGIDSNNLSVASSLPTITNQAQAFGALYVSEGSTLGGKMIAKMLAKNAAYPVPPEALHFFNGYKAETGPMWTGFLAVLDAQNEKDLTIKAANETFFHLKEWMLQQFSHEATN